MGLTVNWNLFTENIISLNKFSFSVKPMWRVDIYLRRQVEHLFVTICIFFLSPGFLFVFSSFLFVYLFLVILSFSLPFSYLQRLFFLFRMKETTYSNSEIEICLLIYLFVVLAIYKTLLTGNILFSFIAFFHNESRFFLTSGYKSPIVASVFLFHDNHWN